MAFQGVCNLNVEGEADCWVTQCLNACLGCLQVIKSRKMTNSAKSKALNCIKNLKIYFLTGVGLFDLNLMKMNTFWFRKGAISVLGNERLENIHCNAHRPPANQNLSLEPSLPLVFSFAQNGIERALNRILWYLQMPCCRFQFTLAQDKESSVQLYFSTILINSQ